MARKARHTKSINLALQGGGAHGAFTWGVLDRIFESDEIWVEAISGTSAGAMNAVVAAQGMYDGQAEGARKALHDFWWRVSQAAQTSPIRRSIWDIFTGSWNLDSSPSYLFFDVLSRLTSPYDMNPMDLNPLRELVGETVNFQKVQDCTDMGLFISATNVETGRVRVFGRDEITLDSVMASACLPFIFKAVEIEGVAYWDGGYTGNPPLFPFFHASPANDIAIVQINPITREGVPTNAREILNRVNEITFNASLLNELRAIDFVRRLIDAGSLDSEKYRRMNVHIIEARKQMRPLGASSKLNAEWPFLLHLRDIGREAADRWLTEHFDKIGVCSSIDVSEMFSGVATLPDENNAEEIKASIAPVSPAPLPTMQAACGETHGEAHGESGAAAYGQAAALLRKVEPPKAANAPVEPADAKPESTPRKPPAQQASAPAAARKSAAASDAKAPPKRSGRARTSVTKKVNTGMTQSAMKRAAKPASPALNKAKADFDKVEEEPKKPAARRGTAAKKMPPKAE